MLPTLAGGARTRRRHTLSDPDPVPSGIPGRIEIVAASTQLPPNGISLASGETFDLDAIVYDSVVPTLPITGLTVNWSSDNTGVVTVHATSGLVSYVANGTATITASVSSGGGAPVVDTEAATATGAVAVDHVTISQSTLTGTAGTTNQVTVQPEDASNNGLAGRTVTQGTSDAGVCTASVSGYTVTLTLVAAGTAVITLTCETKTVTCTVTVNAAVTNWPNEPAGMTLISNVDAGTRPMTGWTVYQGGNNITVLNDWATDPVSPSGALRVNIPTGYAGGGGPEHQEIIVDGLNYSELFLAGSFELSSNFDATPQVGSGDPSGSQKFFHVWPYSNTGPSTMVVVAVFGLTTSWAIQFRNQNFHTSNPSGVSYNISGGAGTNVTRGAPHTFEAYMKINTGANADGICRLWLDGVQRLNRTNLVYNTTGTKRFYKVQLNPTVQNGATGGNPAWKSNVDQSITFGHVYLSGKA